MKFFAWNADKNEQLKAERGVSFEEAVFQIENGYTLDIIDHPNPAKYPRQRIFVIDIDHYAYLVPFVATDDEIFLKTMIPSKKMTRKYIYEEKDN